VPPDSSLVHAIDAAVSSRPATATCAFPHATLRTEGACARLQPFAGKLRKTLAFEPAKGSSTSFRDRNRAAPSMQTNVAPESLASFQFAPQLFHQRVQSKAAGTGNRDRRPVSSRLSAPSGSERTHETGRQPDRRDLVPPSVFSWPVPAPGVRHGFGPASGKDQVAIALERPVLRTRQRNGESMARRAAPVLSSRDARRRSPPPRSQPSDALAAARVASAELRESRLALQGGGMKGFGAAASGHASSVSPLTHMHRLETGGSSTPST